MTSGRGNLEFDPEGLTMAAPREEAVRDGSNIESPCPSKFLHETSRATTRPAPLELEPPPGPSLPPYPRPFFPLPFAVARAARRPLSAYPSREHLAPSGLGGHVARRYHIEYEMAEYFLAS